MVEVGSDVNVPLLKSRYNAVDPILCFMYPGLKDSLLYLISGACFKTFLEICTIFCRIFK